MHTRKRSSRFLVVPMAALAVLWVGIDSLNAATIINNVAWPTLPAAETVDVHGIATNSSGRGIRDSRKIRQTFQVDSAFDVEKIYLSFNNYTGEEFTIKIFEVSDVEAGSWSAGTQIGSTITTPLGSAFTGTSNLEITLSALEQFTLPQRNSGSLGYGMELESVGSDDAGVWAHAHDGTDYANPARHYQENGSGQNLNRDMGLAFTAVSEPSTFAFALVIVGLVGLVGMRRLRRR